MRGPLVPSTLMAGMAKLLATLLYALSLSARATTPPPADPPPNAFVQRVVNKPFYGFRIQQTELLSYLNGRDPARNFFVDENGELRPTRPFEGENGRGFLVRDPQSGQLYLYMPSLQGEDGQPAQKESLLKVEPPASGDPFQADPRQLAITASGGLKDGEPSFQPAPPGMTMASLGSRGLDRFSAHIPDAADVDGDDFDGSRRRGEAVDPFADPTPFADVPPRTEGRPPAALVLYNQYGSTEKVDPEQLEDILRKMPEGSELHYWDGKRLKLVVIEEEGEPEEDPQHGYITSAGVGFYNGDIAPGATRNPEGWETEWMVFNPVTGKNISDYDASQFRAYGANNVVLNRVVTKNGEVRLDISHEQVFQRITSQHELNEAGRIVAMPQPVETRAFQRLKTLGPAVVLPDNPDHQLRKYVDGEAVAYIEAVVDEKLVLVRQTTQRPYSPEPIARSPEPEESPAASQPSLTARAMDWFRSLMGGGEEASGETETEEVRPLTAMVGPSAFGPVPTGGPPDPNVRIERQRTQPARSTRLDTVEAPVRGPLGRVEPRPPTRVETEPGPGPVGDEPPPRLARQGLQTLPPTDPADVELTLIHQIPSDDPAALPGEKIAEPGETPDNRIPSDDAPPGSPTVDADDGVPSDEPGPERLQPPRRAPTQRDAEDEAQRRASLRGRLADGDEDLAKDIQDYLSSMGSRTNQLLNSLLPASMTGGNANLQLTEELTEIQRQLENMRADPAGAPVYAGRAAEIIDGMKRYPVINGRTIPLDRLLRDITDAGYYDPNADYEMPARGREAASGRRRVFGW